MKRTLNWDTYPPVLTPEETALLLNCTIEDGAKALPEGRTPRRQGGGAEVAGFPGTKLRAMLEQRWSDDFHFSRLSLGNDRLVFGRCLGHHDGCSDPRRQGREKAQGG